MSIIQVKKSKTLPLFGKNRKVSIGNLVYKNTESAKKIDIKSEIDDTIMESDASDNKVHIQNRREKQMNDL